MATQAQAPNRPVMNLVMNGAQMLAFTFLCWVSNAGVSAVKGFSDKLDGVVASIASIAQEQIMQKRESVDFAQRLAKAEGKLETVEQVTLRLSLKVEQLEKDRTNGR